MIVHISLGRVIPTRMWAELSRKVAHEARVAKDAEAAIDIVFGREPDAPSSRREWLCHLRQSGRLKGITE